MGLTFTNFIIFSIGEISDEIFWKASSHLQCSTKLYWTQQAHLKKSRENLKKSQKVAA